MELREFIEKIQADVDAEQAFKEIFTDQMKQEYKKYQMEEQRAKDGPTALQVQVGGSHYKKWAIQPVEYIHANNIPVCEGNAIKYLTRWRDKGGIADLKKARHFIDLLIELET
ncbi:MAG: DUF3310 domain-containing protein, partial [bacterium]